MARILIVHLVRLCDQAFAQPHSGDGDSPSLIANFEGVPSEALDWLPPGGSRSIREIFGHAASCKFMYDDYAFRTGTFDWAAEPTWPNNFGKLTIDELIVWAEDGHRRWIESISALGSDEELERPRRSSWGQLMPTHQLITTLLHHDSYHAGEINHLRALYMHNDRWAYDNG